MAEIVAQEVIENKIHVIRGKKVMLDRDLVGTVQSRNESSQSGREKKY
jgi:hypothetical protein